MRCISKLCQVRARAHRGDQEAQAGQGGAAAGGGGRARHEVGLPDYDDAAAQAGQEGAPHSAPRGLWRADQGKQGRALDAALGAAAPECAGPGGAKAPTSPFDKKKSPSGRNTFNSFCALFLGAATANLYIGASRPHHMEDQRPALAKLGHGPRCGFAREAN